MSTITTNDVQNLAQLSNIQLSNEEAAELAKDIEHTLTYIDMLGELDTNGVEPTYQVGNLKNVFRDDVIDQTGVARADLLAVAPDAMASQVKVPKVL